MVFSWMCVCVHTNISVCMFVYVCGCMFVCGACIVLMCALDFRYEKSHITHHHPCVYYVSSYRIGDSEKVSCSNLCIGFWWTYHLADLACHDT